MKIAGQRTGETYPEAPRVSQSNGGILAIGETTNAETQFIIGGMGSVDIGLEVDFVAWTPGDVAIVEWWLTGSQNDEIASAPDVNIDLLVDVGSGFAPLSGAEGIGNINTGAITVTWLMSGSVSFASPVAPKIKLQAGTSGVDWMITATNGLLRVTRVPASLFIAGPAGILPP